MVHMEYSHPPSTGFHLKSTFTVCYFLQLLTWYQKMFHMLLFLNSANHDIHRCMTQVPESSSNSWIIFLSVCLTFGLKTLLVVLKYICSFFFLNRCIFAFLYHFIIQSAKCNLVDFGEWKIKTHYLLDIKSKYAF